MRIGILSAELEPEDVKENKRLVAEVKKAGAKPVLINYIKEKIYFSNDKQKVCSINSDGRIRNISVDAVIPRINESDLISISTGILALEALIANGAVSTNSPQAIWRAKDKAISQIALESAGLPTIRGVALASGIRVKNLDQILSIVEPNPKKTVVIKDRFSTWGEDVRTVSNRRDAKTVIGSIKPPILIQKHLKNPVELTKQFDLLNHIIDYRILIIDGKAVTGFMRHVDKNKDARTNVSLGGTAAEYIPTKQERKLAEAAAKAIGLEIAGVDIFPSTEGYKIIEANASPGFGIGNIPDFNIPAAIVDFAIRKANEKSITIPWPAAGLRKSLLPKQLS